MTLYIGRLRKQSRTCTPASVTHIAITRGGARLYCGPADGWRKSESHICLSLSLKNAASSGDTPDQSGTLIPLGILNSTMYGQMV